MNLILSSRPEKLRERDVMPEACEQYAEPGPRPNLKSVLPGSRVCGHALAHATSARDDTVHEVAR